METLSLLAPRLIENPGSEYADEKRLFQGIPGVERTPGGRLWATWYSGANGEEAGNYVLLVSSADGGQTWSKPSMVVEAASPQVRVFDPCPWLDPSGRLWLFFSQSFHTADGRFGVWEIHTENGSDASPLWSVPRRLGDGIMMNKPTVGADGEWMLPISIWAPRDRSNQPLYFDPGQQSGAWAVISRDRGESFEYLGASNTQEQRIFDEHAFIQRPDRSWWMLTRVRHGIWENRSRDGGKTWDHGHLSDIPHIDSRFMLRRLQSGHLLLVRHDPADFAQARESRTRSHLRAFLSRDEGASWEGGLLLDERPGVSYPDGTQMPDGLVHVIYDFGRTKEKQILLATFTEEDVLSGEWKSPAARQKRVVNQARGQRQPA